MTAEDLNGDHVTVGVTIESATLTPEQISQRLGIAWDEAHRIGDPRGHTGKQWDRNIWLIFEKKQGVGSIIAHDLLPACIVEAVHRLELISGKLREIAAVEGAQFFIHITCQSVPGVSLAPTTIRLLADAKLSLDVDIILSRLEET